jgi:hypothetical protein
MALVVVAVEQLVDRIRLTPATWLPQLAVCQILVLVQVLETIHKHRVLVVRVSLLFA